MKADLSSLANALFGTQVHMYIVSHCYLYPSNYGSVMIVGFMLLHFVKYAFIRIHTFVYVHTHVYIIVYVHTCTVVKLYHMTTHGLPDT